MTTPLATMMARHARAGRVEWIGRRLARREPLELLDEAEIATDGLVGDHSRAGKRAVTLIQAEHLPVISQILGRDIVTPDALRRNIVVSGVNLLALRGETIQIGTARLELTVPAHPCSRMEEAFGHGGYSAVRGHGGICARVVEAGRVSIGSAVAFIA